MVAFVNTRETKLCSSHEQRSQPYNCKLWMKSHFLNKLQL